MRNNTFNASRMIIEKTIRWIAGLIVFLLIVQIVLSYLNRDHLNKAIQHIVSAQRNLDSTRQILNQTDVVLKDLILRNGNMMDSLSSFAKRTEFVHSKFLGLEEHIQGTLRNTDQKVRMLKQEQLHIDQEIMKLSREVPTKKID